MGCEVEFLDEADAETMLDSVAYAKMGISIAEYRRRRDTGMYSDLDRDSVPGLVEVSMLAG